MWLPSWHNPLKTTISSWLVRDDAHPGTSLSIPFIEIIAVPERMKITKKGDNFFCLALDKLSNFQLFRQVMVYR